MNDTQQSSRTQVLYPIVSALVAAERFLGPDRHWSPTNDEQRDFLDHAFNARGDLDRIPDVTSVASRDVSEVNRFLADRGFGIALEPFTTPGEFGTASVLDVLVEWLTCGERRPIRAKFSGRAFPGVRISKKGGGVIVLETKAFPSPIALLTTKTGDEVYMTALESRLATELLGRPGVAPELPNLDHLDLHVDRRFGAVVFPMVHLDQRVDIGWLRELHTNGRDGLPAIVAQALQQTRFRMNDIGARAESAVAVGVTRLAMAEPEQDLFINEPFLLWIRRKDCRLPLFVGYFTEECWKDPGGLGR